MRRTGSAFFRIIVCGLLIGGALPLRAAERPLVLSAIEVEGAQRLAPETVRAMLPLKPGETYDAAAGDRALKALFETGQFKDAALSTEGSRLVVRVAEAPLIADVRFEGYAAIEAKDLGQAVTLKAQAPYTQAKARADERRLRDLYRSKGRMTTAFASRFEPQADGRGVLVFAISEGPVNKVAEIRFVGAAGFSARALKGVIRTSESSWLDILKSDAFYDPDRLATDRLLLLRHYRTHGYADAKIVSAEGAPDAAGQGYVVTFTIDEGPRFTFGRSAIERRVEGIDPAQLTGLLTSDAGREYDALRVEKSVDRITEKLLDGGHPFVSVSVHEAKDQAQGIVTVTYRISDREKSTIERIEIHGNSRTQDQVIRRELKFAEGDAYHPLLRERAEARLRALGFFKSVKVEVKRGSGDGKVIADVGVEEDETRDIGFGVGYSQNDGVVGDISLAERNLMGTGQAVKLKLAGGLKRLDAEAGFTRPHLFDSDVAGGADVFYKDSDLSTESSFKSRVIGGDLRASTVLGEHWTADVKYILKSSEIYDVGASASAAIKEAAGYPAAASNTFITSGIGYSLMYDDRDSKRLPTAGSQITLAQEFAGLGGDVRSLKTMAEARTYVPISDSVSLFARASGGYVTGWGGQDVRLLDLYMKGGDLVRGFASAGIGPRDTASANGDALGGTTYVGTSAGAQFGIPLVPADVGLRGEVFADAGSLFGVNSTAANLSSTAGQSVSLRASVGAGLVWDSPIGPLRADYAIPVAKQPFDKTQPFSFGLGQF